MLFGKSSQRAKLFSQGSMSTSVQAKQEELSTGVQAEWEVSTGVQASHGVAAARTVH